MTDGAPVSLTSSCAVATAARRLHAPERRRHGAVTACAA